MEMNAKINLSKASIILKEIANTVPKDWFKLHSAKCFALRNINNQPSLVFLIASGVKETTIAISQQSDNNYSITSQCNGIIISQTRDVSFKELGAALIRFVQ